ncbi:MAG: hypothetical protein WCP97_02405 [bacterium]
MKSLNILASINKLTATLSNLDNCRWYITGGVALRLRVAEYHKNPPEKTLRNHSDIDLLIFSEHIQEIFSAIIDDPTYHLFDSAFVGLTTSGKHSQGEHHHYALQDKKYGVEFGIFEVLTENDDSLFVYTNKYAHKHPPSVFFDKPILYKEKQIPTVSAVWCLYNARHLNPIRKNNDLELIEPTVNTVEYKKICSEASVKPVIYSTYKQWIQWRHNKRLPLLK